MSEAVLSCIAQPARCRTCPVQSSGLCSWFEPPLSREIAARTSQTRFAQGAAILRQGEPASRIGIILSGLVKTVFNNEDGDEQLIQLLHAGQIVGSPDAVDCTFSFEAATDVELCWLPSATLSAAIGRSAAAYRNQLDATLRLLREQQFAQVALRSRNALQRVAHWLHLQIPPDAADCPIRMRILLSRRDLASLLEMTVETLCRSLHQLEERGAIHLAAPDLADLRDRTLLRTLSRAQVGDRLQETLLAEGWEWGASPLPGARPKRLAPPNSSPAVLRNGASPARLTVVNDARADR